MSTPYNFILLLQKEVAVRIIICFKLLWERVNGLYQSVLSFFRSDSEMPVDKKTKDQNDIIQHLPEELIGNILSRIPAEMLHKSVRFVCKRWAYIICNPHFVEEHFRQAKSGLLLESISSVGRSNFLELRDGLIQLTEIRHDHQLRVVGSCDGVALLIDLVNFSTLYVANPVTKEVAMLPSLEVPMFPLHCSNLIVRVPSTGVYKVVHACFCSRKCHWLVFTVGTDNAWRMFNCQQTFNSKDVDMDKFPVPVGQMIYWTGFDFQVDGITYFLGMEMNDETTHKVPFPKTSREPHAYLRMGDYLASFSTTSADMKFEICVLKDWRRGEWARVYQVHMDIDREPFPCPFVYFPVIWLNNEEVLVFEGLTMDSHFYFFCDVKSGETRFMNLGSSDCFAVYLHTNTLLSWETPK
ncbi:putative F-box protein At3g17490 isoform X2 [Diospyros lotus]|uniref:putative F-box protein At3g17490 isoform X2 n=1 Tax=Diospyros lotus TaxID=55363 RepID=UPI00224C87C5|nr:putative F-box protein At3g17490 isoform X2 [Diospyros lotus]